MHGIFLKVFNKHFVHLSMGVLPHKEMIKFIIPSISNNTIDIRHGSLLFESRHKIN